ncbi:Ubiquitinyl hydrolase 1 [Bertholletia excelsa]
MNTHFAESRSLHSPPLDSVDSRQTLDGSSLDSPLPPPPPPAQTLDDLLNSSIVTTESNHNDLLNFDYLSHCRDDQSHSALLLDVQSHKDKEECWLHSSPANALPTVYSSSHWPSWDSRLGSQTSASGWSDWSSVEEEKPSTSDWSEPWHLNEEPETKAWSLVSMARSSEIKPAMVGAGLANLGNTCFLNAVIQCFTHMVPFVQGLRSYNHLNHCECDTKGFCIFCALREHIEFSLASIGTLDRVISPWKLVDNLSNISSNFQRFQQEDAHEFLQCLLDRLDNCGIYLETRHKSLSSVDENLVKQVFGGCLMSKLQCCNCGHCSDTFEPLIDLSLEIDNVETLYAALESFTKVEKIEDPEINFVCENCEEEVSLEKQLILNSAPSVATFHLKRFKNYGSYVEKIDKHVAFPLELDLLPYVSANQKNNVELKYYLYAIVVHGGFTLASGHYYSYIRSAPDAWYRFDDSKVTRVQENLVLSEEAYILFYARQDTPWFSSFMETEKLSADTSISKSSPKSVLDHIDYVCTSPSYAVNDYNCEDDEAGKHAAGVPMVSFDKCINGGDVTLPTYGSHGLITPLQEVLSNSCGGTSCIVEKKSALSTSTENNCNSEISEVENSANTSPTLQRSLSHNLFAEVSPALNHSILGVHLPSKKHVPHKRQLDSGLEDAKRKQARKHVENMADDRSLKLLIAMNGSSGIGSSNSEQSGKMEMSSKRNDKPPIDCHKPNHSSFMHPMAAGRLR